MDKGPKERSMKINIKSQLSISYSSIIIIVLGAVIISYFYNYLSKDDSIYIAYVWCLIDVIPVIILHIIYYIRNNKEEYTLKANGIEYKKDSVTVFYNSYDISKIVIYLPPSLARGRHSLHTMSVESYHYVKVELKNGKHLILTCLMDSRLYENIYKVKGVDIIKKKRVFAFIYNKINWSALYK